ncbi:hypothetical protein [Bacteroides sp. 224]|uniref:hypothetical protein n=1 Tax=Bacteroides sp. 224 TaxID=2302936 RepID=UPI0013D0B35E|nr:hypothetical protein [Bacteroides sp. 224]
MTIAMINDKETSNYLRQFEQFIETAISSKYKNRWKELFQKGSKGWAKIDVSQAWDPHFSCVATKAWERPVDEIVSFLQEHKITSYVFYGMGNNKYLIEEEQIDRIPDCLRNNIEGIYLLNNGWALINNHDGEILVLYSK